MPHQAFTYEIGAWVDALSGARLLKENILGFDSLEAELTKKEYALLLCFISHKNKVIAKNAIAIHLWEQLRPALGATIISITCMNSASIFHL